MPLELKSPAFANNERLPLRYTGDGENLSPPLTWSGLPKGTKELALLCEDPDASKPEPWVHWLIYRIDPKLSGLDEGIEAEIEVSEPAGLRQEKNTWGRDGYGGPAPPRGSG